MSDIPIPPVHMMFDGPQDEAVFIANGEEYLQYYKDLAGLQPNERVLDVGSGIGRKTIPLITYLTEGSYDGIDCNVEGVQWCQENITPANPNFRFQHVDVRAPGYNPNGTIHPEEFVFPFDDDNFDLVALNSVFTHMLPEAVETYLDEIYRVLKPGGRCLVTWFLVPFGMSDPPGFPFRFSCGYTANSTFPEQAIAYPCDWILAAYREAGLQVTRVEKGTWSGDHGLSYQDIIVAKKGT
jgi:SAM-dependent methyltransferase